MKVHMTPLEYGVFKATSEIMESLRKTVEEGEYGKEG